MLWDDTLFYAVDYDISYHLLFVHCVLKSAMSFDGMLMYMQTLLADIIAITAVIV